MAVGSSPAQSFAEKSDAMPDGDAALAVGKALPEAVAALPVAYAAAIALVAGVDGALEPEPAPSGDGLVHAMAKPAIELKAIHESPRVTCIALDPTRSL